MGLNLSAVFRVQKGKELNDFQRNLLDIEILSNLRFVFLEIRVVAGLDPQQGEVEVS
jgi:hypothetical protein